MQAEVEWRPATPPPPACCSTSAHASPSRARSFRQSLRTHHAAPHRKGQTRPGAGVLAVPARPVTPTSAQRPVAPQRARSRPSRATAGANREVTAGPGGGRPAVARMLGTRREIVTGLRCFSAGCRPMSAERPGPVTLGRSSGRQPASTTPAPPPRVTSSLAASSADARSDAASGVSPSPWLHEISGAESPSTTVPSTRMATYCQSSTSTSPRRRGDCARNPRSGRRRQRCPLESPAGRSRRCGRGRTSSDTAAGRPAGARVATGSACSPRSGWRHGPSRTPHRAARRRLFRRASDAGNDDRQGPGLRQGDGHGQSSFRDRLVLLRARDPRCRRVSRHPRSSGSRGTAMRADGPLGGLGIPRQLGSENPPASRNRSTTAGRS